MQLSVLKDKTKRLFEKSNLLLALAQVRLHNQNPPAWVKNLDFVLVHGGRLGLCSSELYSPKTP